VRSRFVKLLIQLAFVACAIAAFVAFRHAGFAVVMVVIFTYISVLILVIAVMLNYPRLPRRATVNEFADELEARDLLVSTNFRADRAFRVGEFEEEGPHYFLLLENASILHLSGNYLFDYEPIDGLPRHFPCTEFTVRRHAEVGYVVDLICGGLIIEPEVEAPPYSAQDVAAGRIPEDGAILCDISFDQLRQERAGPKSSIQ